MSQEVFYQIRFKEKVNINGMEIEYSDALYYPTLPDQSVIDAVKAERVANWTEAVKNPPKPVEPTKEDMEREIQALEEQKVSLESRKVELQGKISAISVKEEPEEVKP